jgi:rhodanese-related sulfurtransferase/rubrerythrin
MEFTCSVDQIKRLKPEQMRAILDNDTTGSFQLLDVRQLYEYEEGHIPGAKWIPLSELEYRQGELDRDKEIITYCRSGHRGMAASILLCGLGFKNLYNLDGGMLNWYHEVIKGIPEERPELITGTEEVGDILRLALSLEKGGFDFYTKAYETLKDQKAAQTFQTLAHMEARHIERLYERYSQLLGASAAIPPIEQLKAKSGYMEGNIKIADELLKLGKRELIDDFEALEIALENEYMSYDFYKRVAEFVSDSKARRLLYELAGEERNHIHTLLQQLEEPMGDNSYNDR